MTKLEAVESPKPLPMQSGPEQQLSAIRSKVKAVFMDLADVRSSTWIEEEDEARIVEDASKRILGVLDDLDAMIDARREP